MQDGRDLISVHKILIILFSFSLNAVEPMVTRTILQVVITLHSLFRAVRTKLAVHRPLEQQKKLKAAAFVLR